MLNEEVAKYRELSGDTNPNTPISRIGGYLDGYEKALEQEPNYNSISAELNGDAISRQVVLDTEYQIKEINGIEYVMLSEVQMKIRKMPPVNPTKTGHWIDDGFYAEGHSHKAFHCSGCGYNVLGFKEDLSNFCPSCGCRMVEPQERSE